MSELKLKNPTSPETVIFEEFDEDNDLTVLTVVDSEGTPATVTVDPYELVKVRDWIVERVIQLDASMYGMLLSSDYGETDHHLHYVAGENRPEDED